MGCNQEFAFGRVSIDVCARGPWNPRLRAREPGAPLASLGGGGQESQGAHRRVGFLGSESPAPSPPGSPKEPGVRPGQWPAVPFPFGGHALVLSPDNPSSSLCSRLTYWKIFHHIIHTKVGMADKKKTVLRGHRVTGNDDGGDDEDTTIPNPYLSLHAKHCNKHLGLHCIT